MKKSIFVFFLICSVNVFAQLSYHFNYKLKIKPNEELESVNSFYQVVNSKALQYNLYIFNDVSGDLIDTERNTVAHLYITKEGETNYDFLEIHNNKPTVIIYYPGKDLCNSSGTLTAQQQFSRMKLRERQANRIVKSNFLYLYKDKEGIKTIKKINWKKDPENIIENTFFNYHYPCSSYVILYKNKYRSYLGEFPPEYILTDLKEIIK